VDEHDGEIWNASASALSTYLLSLGKSLEKLVVQPGLRSKLRATGLIRGIHGVFGLGRIDGYHELVEMLSNSFDLVTTGDAPNFFEFPYDWRLSNRISAQQLKELIDARLAALLWVSNCRLSRRMSGSRPT
jgi:hypothetical protein